MRNVKGIVTHRGGHTSMEYGLVCAFIAVGILASLHGMRGELAKPFEAIKAAFAPALEP